MKAAVLQIAIYLLIVFIGSDGLLANNNNQITLQLSKNKHCLVGKQPILFMISNYSSESLSSFTVVVTANGIPLTSHQFSGLSIANSESQQFNFPHKWQAKLGNNILELSIVAHNGSLLDNDEIINAQQQISGAGEIVEKVVFFEHFTSENCSSCAFFNDDLFSTLDANPDKITAASFHAYWFDGSIYNQNTADHTARVEYYSIPGTPRVVVDGQTVYTGANFDEITNAEIDFWASQTSNFKVLLNESLVDSTATVNVEITPTTDVSSNTRFYVIIIEDNVTYGTPPGTNGESVFKYLLRDIISNNNGETLNSTATDVPTTFSASYTIPSFAIASNLRTLVIVQDNLTDEILQAYEAPNATGTNVGVGPVSFTPEITLNTEVLLSGTYNTSTGNMNTTLQTFNLVPTAQPFNQAPWNYNGTEIAPILPPNTVDWVLLELRANTDIDVVIATKAALLLSNGTVVNSDGSNLTFTGVAAGESYYIVMRHRNHLAVVSSVPVNLPNATVYSFTNALNVQEGAAQLQEVTTGVYALRSGDLNADGIITVNDFNQYAAQSSFLNVYTNADCDLNRTVTIDDFNLYQINSGSIGVSTIRY